MIVPFATDIVLLLIMFVGLLRLRCHIHRTFAMGRFLWNQVGGDSRLLFRFQLSKLFPAGKGVIWLLISTISGVIPTASIDSYHVSFSFISTEV
jgi:hypothetical protein